MAAYKDYVDGLSHILADMGVIKRDDIEVLITDFDGHALANFEDFLLEEGIVYKDQLLKALETYYGVAAIDVMGELYDYHYLQYFPKNLLLRYNCIPIRKDGNVLIMVAGDPSNAELDVVLGQYASYDFVYFVGIPRHIRLMIRDVYDDSLQSDATTDTDSPEDYSVDADVDQKLEE
jgi:hypothetical protein